MFNQVSPNIRTSYILLVEFKRATNSSTCFWYFFYLKKGIIDGYEKKNDQKIQYFYN